MRGERQKYELLIIILSSTKKPNMKWYQQKKRFYQKMGQWYSLYYTIALLSFKAIISSPYLGHL